MTNALTPISSPARLGRTHSVLAVMSVLFALLGVPPLGAQQAPRTPLPEVDLSAYDPEVRAVIESARSRVRDLESTTETDPRQLAEAYGNLGRASLFYLQGDLARASLQNATELSPDEFRWHYYLGAHFHDERELAMARASLERAVELQPDDGPSLIRLGQVLLLLDEPARATEVFEIARAKAPWEAAALYGLGRSAARSGETQTAIDLLEQALELQPEAAEIRQQLGQVYRDAGEIEAAREHLVARPSGELSFPDPLVAGLGQDFANSAVYRGLAAQSAGRLEEAAREYGKAVEGDPENVAYRQALGGVLMLLKDNAGAIREFQEAVRLGPDNAMARVSLGKAMAQRDGLTQEVAEQFRTARELAPDLKEARAGLAEALARTGRFEEAVTEFEAAVQLDPEDAGLRLLWGEILLILNRDDEALEQLRIAVEAFPGRPQALLAFGRAASRQGDNEAAREALEQVIASSTDTSQRSVAHLELAESLDRLGDTQTALTHYRAAANLLPEYKSPQLALARALARAELHAEAADVYSLLVLLDSEDPALRQGRARSLASSGRIEQAIVELTQAWKDLSDPAARAAVGLDLAAYHRQAGATAEAIEVLSALVEESPNLKDAHFNLAVERGRQGRGEEARLHLARVVELDPDDVEARLLLAQVWAGSQRFAEARETLESALVRLPDNQPLMRALVFLLVGSPDRAVRDTAAALPLAMRLYELNAVGESAALVAAALAGSQRLEEAVEWQTRAIAMAEEESLPAQQVDLMRRDLARYRERT